MGKTESPCHHEFIHQEIEGDELLPEHPQTEHEVLESDIHKIVMTLPLILVDIPPASISSWPTISRPVF